MDIESAREQWQPELVYLNTASFGLPPRSAWDALQGALDEWRAGRTSFLGWEKSVNGSRAAFARIVGVPVEWVAVGSTVSAFAAIVAAALPEGSTILVPEIEFSSNLFPWMVHEDRKVQARMVPLNKLIDSIDESVSLVAFSIVQSSTGEVTSLEKVSEVAHAKGAKVFADATQACGWLPVDASKADYLACAGYKWLMAPRGTAYMVVPPEELDDLRPLAAGWFAGDSVHDSYYGPPLRLATSTRRLDISPAWFSFVGAQPALELIESIGIGNIREHNVELANRFRAGLGVAPGNSAIVSVDAPGAEESLAEAGILASVRGGLLRACFHVYNTPADVDAALEVLTHGKGSWK
jgi:selenocysteine lyase/cysteine desulfurase